MWLKHWTGGPGSGSTTQKGFLSLVRMDSAIPKTLRRRVTYGIKLLVPRDLA